MELLRYYLQANAGHLWVDFAAHRDAMNREDFRFEKPNPYGGRFERHTAQPDPKTVRKATVDGDLVPEVVQGDPRSWGERPKGM